MLIKDTKQQISEGLNVVSVLTQKLQLSHYRVSLVVEWRYSSLSHPGWRLNMNVNDAMGVTWSEFRIAVGNSH